MNLKLGVKIYDNAWFLRHRLSPDAAADWLARLGATYVITQSRFLPMADSAVASSVSAQQAADYAALDDIAFRRALRERGIAYWACLNIGFDPAFSAAHPDTATVDQHGRSASQQDWYLGISPLHAGNLAHKTALLQNAITALAPDGIHLGFVRWPGFWETWLPSAERSQQADYSYDPATLRAFCVDTQADVPTADPVRAAQHIAQHHAPAWRDWKCRVTQRAIHTIRRGLSAAPGTAPATTTPPLAINTLPFFQADFDNAVENVFGQDITRLSEGVDVFEVMAYHQMLGRDAAWPAAISTDIKARCRGRAVICTLQVQAHYLHGMHAGRGRAAHVSADEFCAAVDALEKAPIDGMCLFTLSDLLASADTQQGQQKIARLARFRA